jgi:hypothetical protein
MSTLGQLKPARTLVQPAILSSNKKPRFMMLPRPKLKHPFLAGALVKVDIKTQTQIAVFNDRSQGAERTRYLITAN